MVKGKRVKTIEVHSHRVFQDAVGLMGDDARKCSCPKKPRNGKRKEGVRTS
jgi:hypothetical protein